MIYASGFGLGILWIVLSITGLLRKLVQITPEFIVRGIQLALGLTLAKQAMQWMIPAPFLGLLAIAIILVLRENRYAPASIVIMVLGVAIIAWQGNMPKEWNFEPTLPIVSIPNMKEIWQTMLLAGFAQIPLSVTNAIIAPAALIRDYFPNKKVTEEKLMLNMGFMNVIGSLFSGMPMCHGAGGLAGQYYFGARTGGASVMEGTIELGIGLFLSKSIASIMSSFPMPLIAGMMVLVGFQLSKPAIRLKNWELALACFTAVLSLFTNIGLGFLGGLAASMLYQKISGRHI